MINYWDGKLDTAHTALSFGFDDGQYVAVSVEIRGQKGDTYEFLRGLFKQFELFYVIGDERDVIRVRTNYQNEEVHLYRTNCTSRECEKIVGGFFERRRHASFVSKVLQHPILQLHDDAD